MECLLHKGFDMDDCGCTKKDIDEAVKSSEEYDKSKMQSKEN